MVVAEVSEKVRGRTVAVGLSNSPMAKDGDARNVQSQLCLWRSGRLRWGVAKRQRRGPQFQPLGRGHQAADELARMLEELPRTVVLVTHDIEEAAQLADRILVLSDRPARICRELRIAIPRPRELTHPQVVETVHAILAEFGLEQS